MFEKEVTDLCCSTCKGEVFCKERCECWTFAKKGAEFGYNKANEELEEKIKVKKLEILGLKSQIKKMKCDVIFLIKDRMNDDIDQNIIERLVEKWETEEND